MTRLLLPLLVLASGCGFSQPTPPRPTRTYPSSGKILYVGSIDDLRRPTRSATDTDVDQDPADVPALVRQREVRIPPGEIRSVFSDALTRAGIFERVVSPPAAFSGATPDATLAQAQQASDYLLVGEVNLFHIKNSGYNGRAGISIPLDILFAPVSFITYFSTGTNMFLFTGALRAALDAEVVLTISVSLIDVATGQPAHTIRLAERVRAPYDGIDAFGSFWDGSDDWVDLGRRLGEVALHNATVELAERLHQALAVD